MALVSRLDENLYTKIPDEIIEKAGLEPGSDVIWLYDEASEVIVMKKPKSYAKTLRGLGKELWVGTDTESYIREERDSW